LLIVKDPFSGISTIIADWGLTFLTLFCQFRGELYEPLRATWHLHDVLALEPSGSVCCLFGVGWCVF